MKIRVQFLEKMLFILPFALPPVLAIWVGKLMFEMLAFDFPELGAKLITYFSLMHGQFPIATVLMESKARIAWLTCVLVYFFVNLGFFCFLWSGLRARAPGRIWLPVTIVLLFCLGEIFYLISVKESESPIKFLFHFSFDALSASSLISAKHLSFMSKTLDLINLIAIAAAPLSIVTACCVISQPAEHTDQINAQFKWLKDFVKGSSAVMLIGLIHMELWLSWPIKLIPEFPNIKELNDIVFSIIQYWGFSYSVTIAALYIPMVAHLRKKASACRKILAEKGETPTLAPGLEEGSGMQIIAEKIPQIAAILAPMVIGTLSPAMNNLFAF